MQAQFLLCAVQFHNTTVLQQIRQENWVYLHAETSQVVISFCALAAPRNGIQKNAPLEGYLLS